MLLDGYIILTQDQINMLALAAEPVQPAWDQPFYHYTGYPVLVAPEWPKQLTHGRWTCFAMDGTLYAFDPEEVRAGMERSILESAWGGQASSTARDYGSIGLFQQTPHRMWWGI
jgi:hypothetical protein